ncbi:hypothetical protein SAMN05660642_00447 [Geodermatophilus siccatus]|uniref:Uncharacterized protein n=1 Tax=Geodermatophilus siccatus TaxID=1137991 RepID=A0A1G9LJ87_9ACTN|nr:hypothetical protein SAMN05660642_00447 [Geodermatophilus siccatus]
MTRRWTLRLVTGLAAGALVLSGCSERQEAADTLPEADATPSASQPELPPLGPTDLPMPAEARTQDAAGAEAFVRYYIDLINRTSTVMDAAPLREFSDGCLDCDRIAHVVDKDAALGHQYDGGLISITTMGEALLRETTAEMAMRADVSGLAVEDASGNALPDLSSPAYTNLNGGAALKWDARQDTWIMTALTLE